MWTHLKDIWSKWSLRFATGATAARRVLSLNVLFRAFTILLLLAVLGYSGSLVLTLVGWWPRAQRQEGLDWKVQGFEVIDGGKERPDVGEVVAGMVIARIQQVETILSEPVTNPVNVPLPGGDVSFSFNPVVSGTALRTGATIKERLNLEPLVGKGVAEVVRLSGAAFKPKEPVLRGTVLRSEGLTELYAEVSGVEGIGPWHASSKGGLTDAIDLLSHAIVWSVHAREEGSTLRRLDAAAFRKLVTAVEDCHDHMRALGEGDRRGLPKKLRRAEAALAEIVDQGVPCAPAYAYLARARLLLDGRANVRPLLITASALDPTDPFPERILNALDREARLSGGKPYQDLGAAVREGWAFSAIGLPPTLKPGLTGKNVTVAILSTGVDLKRPELQGRQILGRSFIPGEGLDDKVGVGTSRATLVATVAPGAKLVVAKVLGGPGGQGTEVPILDGFAYALEQKPDIIVIDATLPSDPIWNDLFSSAWSKGALIIRPAGQASRAAEGIFEREPYAPGRKHFLCVGSIDRAARVASFTNRGPGVDLYAPGVDVFSSWLEGKGQSLSGNGTAAALTAGVAALVKEARPKFTPNDLANALLMTARVAPDQPGVRMLRVPRED